MTLGERVNLRCLMTCEFLDQAPHCLFHLFAITMILDECLTGSSIIPLCIVLATIHKLILLDNCIRCRMLFLVHHVLIDHIGIHSTHMKVSRSI